MHECFSAVDGDSWFDSALSNSRRRHKPQSYFIDQQRHPERYSAVHGNIQLDVSSCNQLLQTIGALPHKSRNMIRKRRQGTIKETEKQTNKKNKKNVKERSGTVEDVTRGRTAMKEK